MRLGKPPRWSAGVYLAASVVTVLAYALDKSAARRGAWRTPEGTLHLLALVGGIALSSPLVRTLLRV